MTDRSGDHDGVRPAPPARGPDDARDARDIAAAEYVLGLLEPSQHADFADRLENDPELRRSVGLWTRRLEPLLEEAHGEAARAGLIRRIERELASTSRAKDPSPASPSSTVPDVPVAPEGVVVRTEELRRIERERARAEKIARANARASARTRGRSAQPPSRGLWGSLAFWRGLSLTALAACAALAVAVVTEQDLRRYYDPVLTPLAERYGIDLPRGPLLAALGPADGADIFLLSYQGGRLSAQTVSIDNGQRVPELWLVPEDGSAPRSLGLLPPPGESLVLDVPAPSELANLSSGTTLAVSLEPPGGAPDGVATGPIIAQGQLIRP